MNFITKYNQLKRQIADASHLSVAHPDEDERNAANAEKKTLEEHEVSLFNEDNYNELKWEYEILHKLILQFRDNGCGDTRVMDLNNKIKKLEADFNKNIADNVFTIELTESQCAEFGIKESPCPLSPSLYEKIITTCDDEDLRRRATVIRDTVIPANMEVLKELYSLRQQKSKILGYAQVSDMIHAQMSVKNANEFLTNLAIAVKPIVNRDLDRKSQTLGVPREKLVEFHNRRYYNSKYIQARQDVDLSAPRYKLLTVIQVIKELYAEILNIDIEIGNESVWIDLPVFKITEDSETKYIYLDMHHRDGKFPHPSEWPVFGGGTSASACMMCCVDDMVSHNTLESIFHEVGHCFNVVLNKVKQQQVGGINVVRDIVEVPSMYFENYVWKVDNIMRLGIDRETAEKIAKCHNPLNAELVYINTCMAVVDIAVNNRTLSPEDAPKFIEDLSGFGFTHGNFMTRWIHQAGYECVYYSYVYAMCWASHITEDKIKEYLQYSSAENLEKMFGPLNVEKFVKSLVDD